jgi:hypothetical protein
VNPARKSYQAEVDTSKIKPGISQTSKALYISRDNPVVVIDVQVGKGYTKGPDVKTS